MVGRGVMASHLACNISVLALTCVASACILYADDAGAGAAVAAAGSSFEAGYMANICITATSCCHRLK